MAITPTQRSLKKLRDEGYAPEVVERWNAYAKIRHDLWNCLDIIAVNGRGVVGVQTTSGSALSARLAKLRLNPLVPLILASGIRIELHGWRKLRNRSTKKSTRWECRVIELTAELLNPRDPNNLDMFHENQAHVDSVTQGLAS